MECWQASGGTTMTTPKRLAPRSTDVLSPHHPASIAAAQAGVSANDQDTAPAKAQRTRSDDTESTHEQSDKSSSSSQPHHQDDTANPAVTTISHANVVISVVPSRDEADKPTRPKADPPASSSFLQWACSRTGATPATGQRCSSASCFTANPSAKTDLEQIRQAVTMEDEDGDMRNNHSMLSNDPLMGGKRSSNHSSTRAPAPMSSSSLYHSPRRGRATFPPTSISTTPLQMAMSVSLLSNDDDDDEEEDEEEDVQEKEEEEQQEDNTREKRPEQKDTTNHESTTNTHRDTSQLLLDDLDHAELASILESPPRPVRGRPSKQTLDSPRGQRGPVKGFTPPRRKGRKASTPSKLEPLGHDATSRPPQAVSHMYTSGFDPFAAPAGQEEPMDTLSQDEPAEATLGSSEPAPILAPVDVRMQDQDQDKDQNPDATVKPKRGLKAWFRRSNGGGGKKKNRSTKANRETTQCESHGFLNEVDAPTPDLNNQIYRYQDREKQPPVTEDYGEEVIPGSAGDHSFVRVNSVTQDEVELSAALMSPRNEPTALALVPQPEETMTHETNRRNNRKKRWFSKNRSKNKQQLEEGHCDNQQMNTITNVNEAETYHSNIVTNTQREATTSRRGGMAGPETTAMPLLSSSYSSGMLVHEPSVNSKTNKDSGSDHGSVFSRKQESVIIKSRLPSCQPSREPVVSVKQDMKKDVHSKPPMAKPNTSGGAKLHSDSNTDENNGALRSNDKIIPLGKLPNGMNAPSAVVVSVKTVGRQRKKKPTSSTESTIKPLEQLTITPAAQNPFHNNIDDYCKEMNGVVEDTPGKTAPVGWMQQGENSTIPATTVACSPNRKNMLRLFGRRNTLGGDANTTPTSTPTMPPTDSSWSASSPQTLTRPIVVAGETVELLYGNNQQYQDHNDLPSESNEATVVLPANHSTRAAEAPGMPIPPSLSHSNNNHIVANQAHLTDSPRPIESGSTKNNRRPISPPRSPLRRPLSPPRSPLRRPSSPAAPVISPPSSPAAHSPRGRYQRFHATTTASPTPSTKSRRSNKGHDDGDTPSMVEIHSLTDITDVTEDKTERMIQLQQEQQEAKERQAKERKAKQRRQRRGHRKSRYNSSDDEDDDDSSRSSYSSSSSRSSSSSASSGSFSGSDSYASSHSSGMSESKDEYDYISDSEAESPKDPWSSYSSRHHRRPSRGGGRRPQKQNGREGRGRPQLESGYTSAGGISRETGLGPRMRRPRRLGGGVGGRRQQQQTTQGQAQSRRPWGTRSVDRSRATTRTRTTTTTTASPQSRQRHQARDMEDDEGQMTSSSTDQDNEDDNMSDVLDPSAMFLHAFTCTEETSNHHGRS